MPLVNLDILSSQYEHVSQVEPFEKPHFLVVSEEWTFNISKSYEKKNKKKNICRQFHENTHGQFHSI
jgi:hypothetical protein